VSVFQGLIPIELEVHGNATRGNYNSPLLALFPFVVCLHLLIQCALLLEVDTWETHLYCTLTLCLLIRFF
jgi:hypothetical protein